MCQTAVLALFLTACGSDDLSKEDLPKEDLPEEVSSVDLEAPQLSLSKEELIGNFIDIQSRDNETIITGIEINRGNCLPKTFSFSWEKYAEYIKNRFGVDVESDEYKNDKVYKYGLVQKDGKVVRLGISLFTLSMPDYDSSFLDKFEDDAKAAFVSKFPTEKIPFGDTYRIETNCNINKIIEVTLHTNGGSFTYNW